MDPDNKHLLFAISFAARAHKNQFRNDNETPYISHAFRVCMILRQVFQVDDEEVLAAAVLHDTIEDTNTDFDNIDSHFNRKIAKWVSMLSKDKRLLEDEREIAYEERIRSAPVEVKLIKLADIYDNIMDAASTFSKDLLKKSLLRSREHLQGMKEHDDERLQRALGIVETLVDRLISEIK
ncbi:MAG: HD domain-containing protein [Chlamydiota bacterium]|nr:HD domain-containing protein [Chlamydiota bacterium]